MMASFVARWFCREAMKQRILNALDRVQASEASLRPCSLRTSTGPSMLMTRSISRSAARLRESDVETAESIKPACDAPPEFAGAVLEFDFGLDSLIS